MQLTSKINGIEVDFHKMEQACGTKENAFMPLVQEVYPHAKFYEPTDGRQLIYVDNGASLLSVCHLDGTMPASHFYYGPDYNRKDILVFSPFVDDRIGAYIQLYVYPQLGIKTDLLFTVGEESGRTTAQFFNQPNRQYNWMFEFDRMGTDVVHYQYTKPEWLKALGKHFLEVNGGMFSDIGRLYHLGCQGVNIGCGYHDYTNKFGWCSMLEMTAQCRRFKNFYEEFKDKEFHHDPKQEARTGRRSYGTLYTEQEDLPWSEDQLKPQFRSRKAKILKVNHVGKNGIKKGVKVIPKAEIDAAVSKFNKEETEKNSQVEKVVNEAVKEKLKAIAATVPELIEVQEPVKELTPEPPVVKDTKLLNPGIPVIN